VAMLLLHLVLQFMNPAQVRLPDGNRVDKLTVEKHFKFHKWSSFFETLREIYLIRYSIKMPLRAWCGEPCEQMVSQYKRSLPQKGIHFGTIPQS
jgi:hypothetical protein